jgi:hypothetical protein
MPSGPATPELISGTYVLLIMIFVFDVDVSPAAAGKSKFICHLRSSISDQPK